MPKRTPKEIMLHSVHEHAEMVRDRTVARNRAIVGAREEGATYDEIAEAAGLTRQGVMHIVNRDTTD